MKDVSKIELLMGVMNLLPSPVYIKDSNHVWVEVNAAFCEFLGRTREELIGHTDHDYFPKEEADVFWDMDDRVFETRVQNVNIEQNSNAAGEIRWVESSKSYFEDGEGNAFLIGVLTDVTELKDRERDLEAAEKAAVNASRSKSEFLANMSHEIRTPMNGVLGMSQVLRRTNLTPEQEEIVTTIERSGEALLTIINDILDFSKIEAGKFEVDCEAFSLVTVVDDVAMLLASGAADKGVELITDVSPDLPAKVVGDAGRIRQVLTNLLGNAIKFTAEGYVLVNVSGETDGDRANLVISVEDTGIGIAAGKLDAIFRQFEQADSSTTRRFGGTGLGLSICRSIAEAMGGEISVSSEEGKGSTFRVTLSLPVAEAAAQTAEPAEPAPQLPGLRTLVLDDIEINCRIAEMQLIQKGIHADTTTDPKQALKMLVEAHNQRQPYRLLVLDYQMPGIDGLKVTRMIRSKPAFAGLKILVLSSVDSTDAKHAFEEAGADLFLVKPLRTGVLAREASRFFAGEAGLAETPSTVAETAPARAPALVTEADEAAAGPRILIAEDNEVNRIVIRGLLGPSGCQLDFANNGQIAFDKFREHDYALILMDISMPVMDGISATREIRAHEASTGAARTPILAVTAHAMRDEQDSFRAHGMDDVLTKPLDQDLLLEAVAHWVGPRQRNVA